MAARLVAAGHPVSVHDARREACSELLRGGASWADSLGSLAAAVDVALLSLPGPPQVEAVVGGSEGLLAGMAAGSCIVDLSTNALATVRELAASCAERGIDYLDCPVSGGMQGAAAGTLVLMVGGEAGALERVRPILQALSREIIHFGPSGAGTVAKLINNQLYLAGEVLFYEGLVLGAKAGLDIPALLEMLEATGVGGVHTRLAPRLLDRNFDDRTFALALAEKDVGLALAAGRSLGVPMPTTAAAHRLFAEASVEGPADRNFWIAFELLERRARIRVGDTGGRGA
jgi:3-hydroxyisobutyrate dehydrogenase